MTPSAYALYGPAPCSRRVEGANIMSHDQGLIGFREELTK